MYWQSVCPDGDANNVGAFCANVYGRNTARSAGINAAAHYVAAEKAGVTAYTKQYPPSAGNVVNYSGSVMKRDKELDGQVAVITGAGSGIGKATALLLAREGEIGRAHV